MIGQCPAMRELMGRLPTIARAHRTTLICGPTGTGKEVIARELHKQVSGDAPYVVVQCGALPEHLVESELFGHTRGAFSGADTARAGLVRSAAGGTLFLDEIDSLSVGTQAKLLRFLETGEFRPVGSDHSDHSDTWVLAATNRRLETEVLHGAFRADLLYRLDVMRIDLPPLRLRGEDLELLATHFLPRADPPFFFTKDAIDALYAHHWPGNVRELKHRVERAALLAPARAIDAAALDLGAPPPPAAIGTPIDAGVAAAPQGESLKRELWNLIERDGLTLAEAMERCEQSMIQTALCVEAENRTRAAGRLKIHVRTLFKKLRGGRP